MDDQSAGRRKKHGRIWLLERDVIDLFAIDQ
jgi:hypothetical protein